MSVWMINQKWRNKFVHEQKVKGWRVNIRLTTQQANYQAEEPLLSLSPDFTNRNVILPRWNRGVVWWRQHLVYCNPGSLEATFSLPVAVQYFQTKLQAHIISHAEFNNPKYCYKTTTYTSRSRTSLLPWVLWTQSSINSIFFTRFQVITYWQ